MLSISAKGPFDFRAIPSVNKALAMELARGEYIDRKENVIAPGNSGTGRTLMAIGLGVAVGASPMSFPRSTSGLVDLF